MMKITFSNFLKNFNVNYYIETQINSLMITYARAKDYREKHGNSKNAFESYTNLYKSNIVQISANICFRR